jgi:predicted ArsR family transcriptional regulator
MKKETYDIYKAELSLKELRRDIDKYQSAIQDATKFADRCLERVSEALANLESIHDNDVMDEDLQDAMREMVFLAQEVEMNMEEVTTDLEQMSGVWKGVNVNDLGL